MLCKIISFKANSGRRSKKCCAVANRKDRTGLVDEEQDGATTMALKNAIINRKAPFNVFDPFSGERLAIVERGAAEQGVEAWYSGYWSNDDGRDDDNVW
jgi:hypothetical protein